MQGEAESAVSDFRAEDLGSVGEGIASGEGGFEFDIPADVDDKRISDLADEGFAGDDMLVWAGDAGPPILFRDILELG